MEKGLALEKSAILAHCDERTNLDQMYATANVGEYGPLFAVNASFDMHWSKAGNRRKYNTIASSLALVSTSPFQYNQCFLPLKCEVEVFCRCLQNTLAACPKYLERREEQIYKRKLKLLCLHLVVDASWTHQFSHQFSYETMPSESRCGLAPQQDLGQP